MHLSRRALTAAVVALPGLALSPTTATASPAAGTPLAAKHCSTRLLSAQEMASGARSRITCFDSFAGALRAVGVNGGSPTVTPESFMANLDGTGLVAIHYSLAGGGGSSLSIAGSTCDGGGISLPPGDPWADTVRSTRHQACSKIKHWTNSDYTGTEQTTNGGSYSVQNLNGSLAGHVESIKYYGPVN